MGAPQPSPAQLRFGSTILLGFALFCAIFFLANYYIQSIRWSLIFAGAGALVFIGARLIAGVFQPKPSAPPVTRHIDEDILRAYEEYAKAFKQPSRLNWALGILGFLFAEAVAIFLAFPDLVLTWLKLIPWLKVDISQISLLLWHHTLLTQYLGSFIWLVPLIPAIIFVIGVSASVLRK
jgi:hypothetical protein